MCWWVMTCNYKSASFCKLKMSLLELHSEQGHGVYGVPEGTNL